MFGDPRLPPRFWGKVWRNFDNDCWEWTAATHLGYGQYSWRGRVQGAHRAAYTELVAEIGEGLHLDHLCRNRRCVNPAHLEPVTPRVNTLRGASPIADQARQTHCVNGHPLDAANTKRSGTHRSCRACNREHERLRKARLRSSGLCPDCGTAPTCGEYRCPPCAERDRRRKDGRPSRAMAAAHLPAATERKILGPFERHPDPSLCEHAWERHLWDQGAEYCPYCASKRPAATEGSDG